LFAYITRLYDNARSKKHNSLSFLISIFRALDATLRIAVEKSMALERGMILHGLVENPTRSTCL